ncbi:MAG: FliI/YscN family ATPase [Pseudomonadota bacterium]
MQSGSDIRSEAPAEDDPLVANLKRFQHLLLRGRVLSISGPIIRTRLSGVKIGDMCQIEGGSDGPIAAEVVAISEDVAMLTPLGDTRGLSTWSGVRLCGKPMIVPCGDGLLGRTVDALGRPLDAKGPVSGRLDEAPIERAPPSPLSRQLISKPLSTGVRVIDGLLTLGRGQRIGIFGGAGAGKSTLLSALIKGSEADVAVIALIGERGREVREFVEETLGEDGAARSVVVAATSDRPALERMKAAATATSIAEHFSDQGKDVLLVMDSITRFARALREIGLSVGEPPTRRGFPPSVFARLPVLLERAGPAPRGTITAIYNVLVDSEEDGDPIADEVRGILDGHVILSPKLAARGHYPAIDVNRSRSRTMGAVVTKEHQGAADRIRALLAKHAELEFLIEVGEYKPGQDELADEAVQKHSSIVDFLRQRPGETTSLEETQQWMRKIAG